MEPTLSTMPLCRTIDSQSGPARDHLCEQACIQGSGLCCRQEPQARVARPFGARRVDREIRTLCALHARTGVRSEPGMRIAHPFGTRRSDRR